MKNKIKINKMEELSFDTSYSYFDDSVGGPPLTTRLNSTFTSSQKHTAYNSYTSNGGYILFDLTKITKVIQNNEVSIVNNTAFFVFFCLFLIILILSLILIASGQVSAMSTLYVLLILSVVIYLFCVLYRSHTISNINSSITNINSDIVKNKNQFDNSIVQLPNHIQNISDALSFSS